MATYHYQPLPPGDRNIRLLQLLPGSDSAYIRCEIFGYTINVARPFGLYEALSYYCGDPGVRQNIFIRNQGSTDYQYCEVTTNVFAALRRLRDSTSQGIVFHQP
jgi:hypothetical protein